MINRTIACIRHTVWILSVLLLISALIIDYSPIWRSILTVIYCIGALVGMKNRRCPYCRRYKLSYNPLIHSEIGYCSACGKRVEYDQ